MEQQSVKTFTYFQYFKGMGLPVYIKVNLSSFGSELVDFLKSLKFDEMGPSEVEDLVQGFDADKFARILTLEEATPGIMRQIGDYSDSDRFGAESIYPKENYSVYRFKGLVLMIYGHSFKEWQMGCSDSFGSERFYLNSKIIIQRYLSWALAPLGILGVWGVPVEEGMVTMKPKNSEGEVVFIDVFKRWIYTQDGHKKLKSGFKFLKLDSSLKDRSIKMKTEHLIPMLTEHCTYFGYGGLSVAARQMIQNISRNYEGHIYPVESFQPRTDLSL